jgi:methyl-accepting chemotaxis protein
MVQPPASTPPLTRQKTATTTTRKTQKDLDNAEAINTDVRTRDDAIGFLTSKEYLLPGKPADILTLSHILLQLGTAAMRMPKALTDGIRAVAILMTDAAAQHMADEITAVVKTQLQEHLEAFTDDIETMRDAIEHVTGAAKVFTGKMEEFNDSFQETTEQLVQATQELTERNNDKTIMADTPRPYLPAYNLRKCHTTTCPPSTRVGGS